MEELQLDKLFTSNITINGGNNELIEKLDQINNTLLTINQTIKTTQLLKMKQNRDYWNKYAFYDSIIEGDIDKLKWLKDNKCPITYSSIRYAVVNNDKKIINWLEENKCLITSGSSSDINYDISKGNIQILKWLKDNKLFDEHSFKIAVDIGNESVIQLLKDRDCPYGKYNYEDAIKKNRLEDIIWLKETGLDFSNDIFKFAVEIGNEKIIQWLKDNGCPFGKYTYEDAIKKKRLEDLIWLKEKGISFSNDIFKFAVEIGNEKIIKWLKDNDCPYGKYTYLDAIKKNRLEDMIWLKEKGMELNGNTFYYFNYSNISFNYNNNIKILELIINNHDEQITKNLILRQFFLSALENDGSVELLTYIKEKCYSLRINFSYLINGLQSKKYKVSKDVYDWFNANRFNGFDISNLYT